MLSSLFSGISGLMSNSYAISVIGNNIANVNTIGYKSSRTTFGDVLYQSIFGTAGTSQVGRGTALTSIDTQFAQGSFESTSEPTDLAIGGKGFFIVKSPDNDKDYFTRAGQFRFNKEGYLTTPAGYKLQGRAIDRLTNAPYGVATDIVVSMEPSEPRATEKIGMVVNLQSNAEWKGIVSPISGTGNITLAQASDSGYPVAGNYTATISAPTLTGTNAVTAPTSGTLVINGTSITLADASAAAIVDAINGQTGTTHVTASESGGRITLTSTAPNYSITVDDSGLSGDGIGWSAGDLTSQYLTGPLMTLHVDQMLGGVSTGSDATYSGVISAAAGTATNFGSSGLDITYGNITTAGTQTFSVQGFSTDYVSASVNPSTTSNYSSSVTVYDSLGQAHVVTAYFRKSNESPTGDSVWEYHTYLNANDSLSGTAQDVACGYLTFNQKGILTSGGEPHTISFDFATGEPGQLIDLIFGSSSGGGASTQYPIASTTNFQTQDGYPPGVLTNVSVSQEGIISGHYSNGQILDLYQITLANFNNPQGLSREGQNLFSETLESGVAYTNAPGNGALGRINPNSLEQSNVDLATEFVKMIITQRGFQANSRIITTTDEMLAELMNIKR
jgi:flagellar hook protein FlgE